MIKAKNVTPSDVNLKDCANADMHVCIFLLTEKELRVISKVEGVLISIIDRQIRRTSSLASHHLLDSKAKIMTPSVLDIISIDNVFGGVQ